MSNSAIINPIILALDVSSRAEAAAALQHLQAHIGMCKIGLELFTALGPAFVRELTDNGAAVMLDLKLHDIPVTVQRATANVAALGARLLTLHAGGGGAMLRAARSAVSAYAQQTGTAGPQLLAVTVLTSIDAASLTMELGVARALQDHVVNLARLAQDAGADGVVASPQEISAIRAACGDGFLIVTPGIRPANAEKHDQQRTCTPSAAIAAGADYIVIGRPIMAASDPVAAANDILTECRAAVARQSSTT
jgi:orotidine-5'-phosphate decarboxylase